MHTQQLLCFVLVADRLNFTKAAEELFLSTPTVTHHIKTLENELKTKLFVRNSKMVKLTESGAAFYEDAKEILEKIHVAEKKLQKIAGSATSFIKIGCTSNAEFNILKYPLTDIHQKYPDITPRIYVNDCFSLKKLFENEQLDLIFSTRSTDNAIAGSFFKLKNIINYAILPASSPLSEKQELKFDDMENFRLITMHPKSIPFEYPNKIRDSIFEHGLTHLDIHCENDQSALLLAECGFGIAILPEFYIPQRLSPLVKIPFEKDSFILEYGITYHSAFARNITDDILGIFKSINIS